MPLAAMGTTLGVFEVLAPEIDDEWMTWLSVIGDRVAKALALTETQAQADAATTDSREPSADDMTTTSRMLIAAEDYDDVAAAAMHMIDDEVQALALTLFEQPLDVDAEGTEGVTANRRYVQAYADGGGVQMPERDATKGGMPEQSFIVDLRRGVPLVVDNVAMDAGYLPGWLREQATEADVKQVIAFGLASADVIVGTMDLLFDEPKTLSDAELDRYTTLSKQVGATILSKRLLRQSLEAQQFAAQLVKTNKAIAAAENYTEMARAVLDDAPESAHAVAIALFNRPFTLMGMPNNLRTEALVTREGDRDSAEIDFVDYFSAVEDARVTYFLNEYLEGRMMLLWNIVRPRPPVMAGSLVDALKDEPGVDIVVSFGLNMGGSLRGILVFAGQESLREPGPQYDGLRAIADQLAAVIENRILLEQTSSALDLIQSQYEMSSRVFQSDDLAGMLRAIYEFAGGIHDRAEMVTTDTGGVTRLVAEVRDGDAQNTSQVVDLDDYPAHQTLSVLEALEVRDVSDDAFISDEERSRLRAAGIGSLVILPIVNDGLLNGLIMLTRSSPMRMSPDRLRAMRSLADQVGVVLENRKLLRSTEVSLEEVQRLYEMNRAMLRTQDVLDVLRALARFAAPDASVISYLTMHYADDKLTRVTLDYRLTDEDATLPGEVLLEEAAAIETVDRYLGRRRGASVIFSSEAVIVDGNPAAMLIDRHASASYAALLIRERDRVKNMVVLLFDEPKPFIDNTRRLYHAAADQVGVTIENQKLLRETQRSAEELSAQVEVLERISDFATQVNAAQGERDLLDTGAQAIVEILNVDHSGIVLFNEDMQTGVVMSEYPRTRLRGNTIAMQDSPILRTDGEQSFAIADVGTDEQLTEAQRQNLLDQGVVSILLVPLIGLNGELFGSLGLDIYDKRREFSSAEVRVAQTIAAQMAIGLQNVRLLRDAQERAEQLQQITDFSQSAQATLNLEEMIDAALVSVPRLLPVTHMTIALYNEVRDELVLVGGWHEDNSLRTTLQTGEVIPQTGTTSGYVFEAGRYLYVPDLHTNTVLRYPHSRTISTLLAMPLVNRGQSLGVVSAGAHRPDAYTDTDIALFQQMVNQMAVAMDNARAYTQNRRIAENKTLANEISVQLQRQNDLVDMVDLTMKQVGRAIGAKRGRVRLNTDQRADDSTSKDNNGA